MTPEQARTAVKEFEQIRAHEWGDDLAAAPDPVVIP